MHNIKLNIQMNRWIEHHACMPEKKTYLVYQVSVEVSLFQKFLSACMIPRGILKAQHHPPKPQETNGRNSF